MSEEQLTALLAKLKDDAGLQEKLKGAADLDDAVSIAREAGFDVSKADWLSHLGKQTICELSDAQLEAVAGGKVYRTEGTAENAPPQCCTAWKGCDDKFTAKDKNIFGAFCP